MKTLTAAGLLLALGLACCGGSVVVGGSDQGEGGQEQQGGDVGSGSVMPSSSSSGSQPSSGSGTQPSSGSVTPPSSGSGTRPSSGSGVVDGSCSMVGTWDGISGVDGSNPSSSASYQFNANGSWIGGQYAKDVAATQFMHGTYSVSDGVFDLTSGYGMGPQCGGDGEATYRIAFEPGCQHVTLFTQTDDCTGARLYMSAAEDGTVFTRRN